MIPENWRWVRLGDVYKINPKNSADDDILAAFVPMEKISSGMSDVFSFEVQPWEKAKKGHTQFADGDVAFAKISPCFENRKSFLAAGLPNGIGGGSTELIVLRQPLMNPRYTFWLVSDERFISGGIQTYSGTVGQQRISMDYVRNYEIPLPPFPEQERIVARIDSLFARLDEAKEKLQSVMDGYELRRAAILHRAFTGELTAKWRAERGVSLESWKQYPLISIFNFIDYRGKTPNKTDAGIPLITARNVKKGYIDYRVREYISEEEFETRKSRGVAAKGDILFTTEAPLGNAAVADCDVYTTAQRVIVLQQNGNVHCENEYVLYYMLADVFQNRVLDKKTGSTVAGIKAAKLKQIPVELPGIEEQRKILSSVRSLLAKEREVFTAAQAALSKIDLMKKSILARAFRGELGTNDPAEECAAVQKGGPSCCAYF